MKQTTAVTLAFCVALVSTLGSLFFSDVMQFIPCSLCWYQRIFMYPLVFIFLINLLYPDNAVFKYAFPLVIIGLGSAFYHNLIMVGIIPEELSPCAQGVACSTEYINWFGFVNIPLLSLIGFVAIFILLLLGKKGSELNEK